MAVAEGIERLAVAEEHREVGGGGGIERLAVAEA